MYSKLKILICDPAVRKGQRGHATWFVSGRTAGAIDRLQKTGDGDHEERKICQEAGDAAVIKILHDCAGNPVEVTLCRGLSSSYQIFIGIVKSKGEIFISDSFRAIVAELPPDMRAPSDDVIIDHVLFGNVFGTNTYSRYVKRVAHGQEVSIKLKTAEEKSLFFDKLPLSDAERSTDQYLEAIDRSLKQIVGDYPTSEQSVVMFSGGIDSTLLGNYAGPHLPYLNMRTTPATINGRLEQKYCDDAAALLGATCDVLYEEPEDFSNQLSACIDSLGCPPQALHMAWFDDAFRKTRFDTYFVGERADALFGHGGRIARFASQFTSPAAFQFLRLLTAVLPSSARFKWRNVLPAAEKLREPPRSPYGYGAQSSMWTTPKVVWRMFPAKLIEGRIEARLQYAMDRVELPNHYESRFHRHFEMAQWVDYFCEDTLPLYRQCAHAHGKTLLSPFISRDLLRIVASIPGEVRYMKGWQGKYLLKRLLKAKVPAYQVDKRKAFPEVPFKELYCNGPLKKVWERYKLPDFVNKDVRDEIMANPHVVTWQVIKYVFWDMEIRAATSLPLPPLAALLEYGIVPVI